MVDPDLAASWIRTETHLRKAAATLRGMPAASNAELAELLDHDELGLALDVLVASALDLDATRECWTALGSAVAKMDLTEDDATHGEAVRVVRARARRDRK